jgi:hypothetical protein
MGKKRFYSNIDITVAADKIDVPSIQEVCLREDSVKWIINIY